MRYYMIPNRPGVGHIRHNLEKCFELHCNLLEYGYAGLNPSDLRSINRLRRVYKFRLVRTERIFSGDIDGGKSSPKWIPYESASLTK
jgi:hypothetical protein